MLEFQLRARPVVLEPAGHAAASGQAGVSVMPRDGLRLVTVSARRGGIGVLRERVSAAFNLNVPEGARRTAAGPVALIGTGPATWLMTADHERPGFAAEIATLLDGVAAVADQSDAFVALRLSGPALRDVLAKGVALDMHAQAFPPSAAATTVVGHIGVMLWRVDDGDDLTIELAAPRSSFGSFWTWLSGSAAEFGLDIVSPAGAG